MTRRLHLTGKLADRLIANDREICRAERRVQLLVGQQFDAAPEVRR